MPELPEVELMMRVLKPYVVGRRLVNFQTDWPRGLKSSISPEKISRETEGLKVRTLRRRGKVLFIALDSPAKLSFAVHLKMSGALLFGKPKILSKHTNKKYVHFIWRFADVPGSESSASLPSASKLPKTAKPLLPGGEELWFRDVRKFGIVWYGTSDELAKDKYLGSLGPDAFTISLAEFRNGVKQHRGQLKPLLLRQDVISGLGNITVDESLWEAGLHSQRHADDLSDKEIKNLHICTQRVLNHIIKAEGNTMRDWVLPDGRTGRAQLRWRVYGREKKLCPRCRNKIKHTVVGGRTTFFCSGCQRKR